jgi:hypothetical protein
MSLKRQKTMKMDGAAMGGRNFLPRAAGVPLPPVVGSSVQTEGHILPRTGGTKSLLQLVHQFIEEGIFIWTTL